MKKVVVVKRFEKYLEETFGYKQFKEKQREVIEAIVKQKRDVCCIMATGHGKSICYQLPPLITSKSSIVISPLLSLMEDQRVNLEKVGVKACCYNSTVVNKSVLRQDIIAGKYQIIYITPETVINSKDMLTDLYQLHGICVVAIDEAHCVSLWGQTFRESYLLLSCFKQWLPRVPILALTGTATPAVENDIIKSLQLSDPLLIRTGSNRPNLSYYIHDKSTPAIDLRPIIGTDSTIVYCPTRKDTEKIAEILSKLGVKCEAYHAGLAPEVRNEIHHNFINDRTTCIVATICFGMGIDKKDIRKVIHYGCPKDIESYCQETGRAGRDSALSQCHVFYAQSDFSVNRSFLRDVTEPSMRKHKESMIGAIEKYLYTTDCRRQTLLDYFGETKPPTDLPCCDNCDHQTDIVTTNYGLSARIFLELIISMVGNYGYGKKKLINVIKGKGDLLPRHPKYGVDHDPLHTIEWWSTCVQHMLNMQLLGEQLMTNGRGSTIYITTQGRKWLQENRGESPVFLIKEINQVGLH